MKTVRSRLSVVVPDGAEIVQPKSVRLVVSKCDAVAREYDVLLGQEWRIHWSGTIAMLDVEPDLAAVALVRLKERIVMLCIEGRCDYEFRFVRLLHQFPWRLAWLVHVPASASSEKRFLSQTQL